MQSRVTWRLRPLAVTVSACRRPAGPLPGRLIGHIPIRGTRDHNHGVREATSASRSGREATRWHDCSLAWLDHFDPREPDSRWIRGSRTLAKRRSRTHRPYVAALTTHPSEASVRRAGTPSRDRLALVLCSDGETSASTFPSLSPDAALDERDARRAGRTFGYSTSHLRLRDSGRTNIPIHVFSRHTERDGAWMTRNPLNVLRRRVSRSAEMGRVPTRAHSPRDPGYERRLQRILERDLTRLSPCADCGRRRNSCAPTSPSGRPRFRHCALSRPRGSWIRDALPVTAKTDGTCVCALPPDLAFPSSR